MRQLVVETPREHGRTVVDAARAVDAVGVVRWRATGEEGDVDLVLLHVGNAALERLLARLSELPGTRASFLPNGVIALRPPPSEAPAQVQDVELRSPIEVFLSGLQSIGSWRGYLAYAAMSGVVVWIGLYTNTSYLLVAAMLIAPFAGPAMNAAIATARGDRELLGRSLMRYGAAIAVTVGVAAVLSWLFGQEIASTMAIETSQMSSAGGLLALAAGVAGAIQLVQSERSSLVSGAGIGMLVAASLAPPAGVAGVGIAVGRPDLIWSGVFLVLLQFVGINLGAAIVFRVHGLSERGPRYDRGTRRGFVMSSALTALALAAMLTWQFAGSPAFQRSSLAQRASADIHQALARDARVRLVQAEVGFTRAAIPGQETLLCVLYVQRAPGAPAPDALRVALTRQVQSLLLRAGHEVTPLVDVRVLEPPVSP